MKILGTLQYLVNRSLFISFRFKVTFEMFKIFFLLKENVVE